MQNTQGNAFALNTDGRSTPVAGRGADRPPASDIMVQGGPRADYLHAIMYAVGGAVTMSRSR